jgi:hypothetical protein
MNLPRSTPVALTALLRRSFAVLAIAGLAFAATSATALAALQMSVEPGTYQTNGTVHAIVRSNGVVYIGGAFTSVRPAGSPLGTGEVTRNNLAAFSAATGALLPWNPSANRTVRTLAVGPGGGTVYAGGDFTGVGGKNRAHIAAMSAAAAGAVSSWAPRANGGGVFSIVTMGTRVFFGGEFNAIGNVHRKRLAAVSSTGKLLPWAAHNGPNQSVRALLISPNGSRIFVGGLFTLVGGKKSAHLAALSSSTGALLSWQSHPKYEILSLAATSSALYAGGGGGGGHLPKYNIANGRLNWTASPDGDVASVSIYHGLLLVGGHFNRLGSQVRHHAGALNLQTGKVDLNWAPDFNQILGVWPVLGYGQDAYVGGDFTKVQSLDQQGFAHFKDSVADTTAPTLSTLPNVHMVVGSTIGPTVPVTLAWKGHDNLSGICRYRVHQKINTGSVVSVVPARPTNTTVARSIAPGTKVYHYSVQPVDCSDNTPGYIFGKTARIVMHQNANGGIAYRGVWHKLRSPGTSGGTITSTSQKNASASLKFTGRQVAWVASKSALRGKARVWIDGKAIKTVDLHSKTLLRRRVVFTRGWTTNGNHTIRIVCLATKGRPAVDIDALLVLR